MKQIPTELVPAFFLACALAAVLVPRSASAESRLAYPPTRTVDAKDVLHEVTVPDPYRWLEDASSPEVRRGRRRTTTSPAGSSESSRPARGSSRG